jgi:flagellin-like protein
MTSPDPTPSSDEPNGRAVSAVIGVILMVAVTVVLAATVGLFVLSFSEEEERAAPQASLDVEIHDAGPAAGDVVFVHESGEPIHSSRTKVIFRRGSDEDVFEPSATDAALTAGDTTTYRVNANDWDGEWSVYGPGSTTTLSDVSTGETVTVTLIDTVTGKVVYRNHISVVA